MRTAVLEGTRYDPVMRLKFGPRDPMPRGVALPPYPRRPPRAGKAKVKSGPPSTVMEWVQLLPGRRWDPQTKDWLVHDPGPDADRVFAAVGFSIDMSRGAAAGVTRMADLAVPLLAIDPDDEYTTWLYPRFAASTMRLPEGRWVKERMAYAIHTPDLAGPQVDPRLGTPDAIAQVARELAKRPPHGASERDAKLSQFLSLNPTRHERALGIAAERHGALPDWFGMDLFGYQECGAYALVMGHTLLADPPGLGKTVQCIAAHTLVGTKRLLVTCPQKVRSNWARHFEATRVAYRPSFEGQRRDGAATVTVIQPGRKLRELPDEGVVIIADTFLSSNAKARDAIIAWNPDGMIQDESHRVKTWDSGRSVVMRALAHRINGLCIASSGTPVMSNTAELVPQLAMTGHLDAIFGGRTNFLTRYCRMNHMGKWVPRKDMLPELRAMLDGYVWVRRVRDEAYGAVAVETDGATRMADMSQLPKPLYIDIDMTDFQAAHAKIIERIDEWLDTLTARPSAETMAAWASGNVSLVSLLRMAAGLAKIPAAAEHVADWVADGPNPESGLWDDPLVVWTHHREVTEAMIAAASDAGAPVAALWGGAKESATEQVEADFQAGKYAVLVGSMHAAGVGLTFTRSKDALFVETDWLPAIVSQAADRIRRVGQMREPSLTVMVAEGTLDDRIQATLEATAKILDPLLGAGNDMSVGLRSGATPTTAAEILEELVQERVAKRFGGP